MKTKSHELPASTRKRPLKAAAKHAKKRSSAPVSIFTEIKKDHASFRKAMDRIYKLYSTDAERAKAAYSEFRVKLQAHAKAEEESLYATLLEEAVTGQALDDQVREGKEEHHVADFLVNELNQIPAADPKWKAKFRVLQESVKHHLEEEEEYFKTWKRKFSRAEDQLVLAQFVNRRASIVAEAAAARH